MLSPPDVLVLGAGGVLGESWLMGVLAGIEDATGEVSCGGRLVRVASPRDALRAGILSLSGDRAAESIFPTLGVRENMTVRVLRDFAAGGLISALREL